MGSAPYTITDTRSDGMRRPKKLPVATEALVYQPAVQSSGQSVQIVAKKEDRSITPWGLWGAAATAVIGFLLLTYEGYRGFHDWNTVMISVALLAISLMAARFGPHNSLVPVVLATFDLEMRELSVPGSPSTIRFDELEELVYAMVRYPINSEQSSLKVQAFSLLVRTPDGDLLPIIEASPDKNAVFKIAGAVSHWTQLEISYVGIGVQ